MSLFVHCLRTKDSANKTLYVNGMTPRAFVALLQPSKQHSSLQNNRLQDHPSNQRWNQQLYHRQSRMTKWSSKHTLLKALVICIIQCSELTWNFVCYQKKRIPSLMKYTSSFLLVINLPVTTMAGHPSLLPSMKPTRRAVNWAWWMLMLAKPISPVHS